LSEISSPPLIDTNLAKTAPNVIDMHYHGAHVM